MNILKILRLFHQQNNTMNEFSFLFFIPSMDGRCTEPKCLILFFKQLKSALNLSLQISDQISYFTDPEKMLVLRG